MKLLAAVGLLVALGTGSCARACASKSSAPASPDAAAPSAAAVLGPRLQVPHTQGRLLLDGKLDEPDWQRAARTAGFKDSSGAIARPYSDARLLWDDENLYVALYAADQNIQTGVPKHDGPLWINDAFSLRLAPSGNDRTSFAIDLSADGVVTDVRIGADGQRDPSWESGTKLGLDRDGTLNDASDEDEEWLLETAIPLAKLGVTPSPGTRLRVGLGRCDTPRGGKRTCGAWGDGPSHEPSAELELEN